MKTTIKKTIATILSLTAVTLTNIAPVATPIPIMEEVTLTASAEMVGSDVHQILFDYIYYADKNDDLKRAFGYNKTALYNHWITYGKKEGRSPSSLYDPIFYRDKYGDLKQVFGNDYVALYNHFVTYGINEGRQASQYFSVEIYKANYEDLRNAFGTQSYNNVKYLQHWREYGLAEKRNGTSKIQNNNTTTYYVTTQAGLILRSSASTSSAKLCTMPYGSSIAVSSISNGWACCTYNGKSGYCSASYISTSKPNSNPTNNYQNLSAALYRNTSARITCGYNGYVNTPGKHEGIDFKLGVGNTIYALTDGEVVRVAQGSNGSGGLSTIAIYNTATNKTVIYLHANPSSELIKGKKIAKGEIIGTEGWRGVSSASGSHTHVEVRDGIQSYAAKSVNDYKLENGDPTSFWNSMGYNVR